MIDAVCVAMVLLLAWFGWRAGGARMILSTAGLIVGYVFAYLFFRPVGIAIGTSFGLQPTLSYPIGGLVVLAVVGLAFSIPSFILSRARRRRREEDNKWSPSLFDRLVGGGIGAGRGLVVVLLVVWGLLWLSGPDGPQGLRELPNSRFGRLAGDLGGRLTAWGTRLATGNDVLASAAGSVAASPAGAIQSWNAVLDDPRIMHILEDGVLSGTSSALTPGSPELRDLANDPAFVAHAGKAGLLALAPGELSPAEVEGRLATSLGDYTRIASTLARDEEVQRLLDDQEFVDLVQSRDLSRLVNDKRFNQLAARVLEEVRAGR